MLPTTPIAPKSKRLDGAHRVARTRGFAIKLNEDWFPVLERHAREGEGAGGLIKQIVYPVLAGKVSLVRDDEGRIVAFRGKGADGNAVEIRLDGAARVEISPPQSGGRPRKPASEKALDALEKAADEEGTTPAELVKRRAKRKK